MLTNRFASLCLPKGDLAYSATQHNQAQVEATVVHRIEDERIAIAIDYNVKLPSGCDSNLWGRINHDWFAAHTVKLVGEITGQDSVFPNLVQTLLTNQRKVSARKRQYTLRLTIAPAPSEMIATLKKQLLSDTKKLLLDVLNE